MIVSEGGINWCWYTELKVADDQKSVEIIRHWRLHRFDESQGANLHPKDTVQMQPAYGKIFNGRAWGEGEGRMALEYSVPGIGPLPISNPKYVFDYK